MIAAAVTRVAHELNLAMKRRFQSTVDLVVVSNLFEPDGTPVVQATDQMAVFLVNIEREASPSTGLGRIGSSGGRTGLYQPPVFLNLMIMLAANFSGAKYPEALKLISGAAAFFQARPVFDHSNTPDLDPGIERLAFEIENLSVADLGNLWGVLGGRYVPSILMRARMVVIDSSAITQQVPLVERPDTDNRPVGAF